MPSITPERREPNSRGGRGYKTIKSKSKPKPKFDNDDSDDDIITTAASITIKERATKASSMGAAQASSIGTAQASSIGAAPGTSTRTAPTTSLETFDHITHALTHFTSNPHLYALMEEKASTKHFGALTTSHLTQQPTAIAMVPSPIHQYQRRKVGNYLMPGVMVEKEMIMSTAIAVTQMNEVEKMIAEKVEEWEEQQKTPEQREEKLCKARKENQEREFLEEIAKMEKRLGERMAKTGKVKGLGFAQSSDSGSERMAKTAKVDGFGIFRGLNSGSGKMVKTEKAEGLGVAVGIYRSGDEDDDKTMTASDR